MQEGVFFHFFTFLSRLSFGISDYLLVLRLTSRLLYFRLPNVCRHALYRAFAAMGVAGGVRISSFGHDVAASLR